VTSEVGLADLLLAWEATGRDPAKLPALARLLGLAPREEPAATESALKLSAGAFTATVHGSTWISAKFTDGKPPGAGPARGEPIDIAVEPAGRETVATPAWRTTETVKAPRPEVPNQPEPLFVPTHERALVATAVKTLRPDGGVNVLALVDSVCRRAFPRVLPRLVVPSMHGGLQLIIDRSSWLQPFRGDIVSLARRFRDVAGAAIEELHVREAPPLMARPGDDEERAWKVPARGTAIVIVTDLGRTARRQGRVAPAEEWRKLLKRPEVAAFDPIVIVPGRPTHYAGLTEGLPRVLVLGWDRTTRLLEIIRFRKAGRRR